MLKHSRLLLGLLTIVSLAACEVPEEEQTTGINGAAGIKNRVNWNTVQSYHNPSIEEKTFNTYDYARIDMNIFGFKDDVDVTFLAEMAPGTATIQIFKVWSRYANWGELLQVDGADSLEILNRGRYSCNIKISNGYIDSLEGGCVVRVRLFLPAGDRIDVYNVGKLITQSSKIINTAMFLERIKQAGWAQAKFDVITAYINSYKDSGSRPKLNTSELAVALREFSFSEDKLKALDFLHRYVSDRSKLKAMIETEFYLADRSRAFAIVGL